MDKLKGMFSIYQLPLLALVLRRGYLKQRIPLVGRYATRYPITEMLEKPREVVKSGADPAMDDKRFRMGHRGMNFDTLDRRLEHSVVPQFSKVRKYRRAPEVWDDEEAQTIADRVRRPGGGLRGGGNVLSQGWKPVEKVEGYGGSGETGMSKVGLMDRLRRRSHSRIEEDEDEEELVSIQREPSVKEAKRGWFSKKRPEEEVIEVEEVKVEAEVVRPPPQPIPDSQPQKSKLPPMFAPFSHLPQRVVNHLLHRVGEPRVFVGSAHSQLVMPDNDPLSQTSLPYRTGSEWNFTESVQFSTPYPTTQQKLRELPKVWRHKTAKKLLVKPKGYGISRWPQHLEIIRDYLQLIGVILGACGFIKAPLNSTVGDRWPWIVLVGVPDAAGLLWADLSTTTGQSYGFLVFFGLLTIVGLVVWVFSVYLEAPKARGGETVTYEEELTEHSRVMNPLSRLTRRQRLNIVYFILAWLYVPVTKLALETIVWGRGYWAVDNPYRAADDPTDPGSFCYHSTMHRGSFNFAYLVVPLACVLFLGLGLVLPVQVHYLVERHMPNTPGWKDGKSAGGFKLPAPSGNQSRSMDHQARDFGDRPRRDDFNPLLSSQQQDPLQGLLNPELLTYAHALYNTFYGAAQPTGGGEMASNAWQIFQKLFSRTANSSYVSIDLPSDMPEDQRYQARVRAMKEHHRNKHLATVQYRQALDQDRSDLRFLYKDHYPSHASDPARWMLWRLVLVVFSVILRKDNCWAKGYSRESLDIGRNVLLILIVLLMLRSHHAHRPYFDPTANLSSLLMRLGLLAAVALAFPLYLINNPLSSAHTGISVLTMVANFCILGLLIWLALSSLPRVSVLTIQPSNLCLSPGILTAKSPYDPRLRRLLIERVWQDTWSAILLGSRDFRLLPNHRVDFTQNRTHPPYMTNYIGFASERHLENLHLYDNIGRQMYCQAVELERHNDRRLELMDQVARLYCGPDQYFNPYAGVPLPGHSLEDPNPSVGMKMKFGVGRDELKSWFGRVEVLHFPFTLCITYDELPDKRVLVVEERDIRMFIEQNTDPKIMERRQARHKLRCLHGKWVTLTYVENMGEGGTHHRYCLPLDPEGNQEYLAQFRGRRRIIYRGKITVGQQEDTRWNQMCNVSAGFACKLELTEQCVVEDTGDLDGLDRSQAGCLRRVFWETGQSKGFPSANSMRVTEQSQKQLRVSGDNRHLLGVTWGFDQTENLRALFDENQDLLDLHLDEVQTNHRLYQQDLHRGFIRKRTGLSPSFHTDVFAPGPESYHLLSKKSSYPSTPTLNDKVNGVWQNDKYGRLSCIPTLEQLQERLETVEENPYMRQLLVDHRDDITLLYERLRTLVPSQSNDPVKFGWYIFWDDLYRRYAGQVQQLKEFEADFCPLYPQSLAYYPLPRHRLERFLYERGLWEPTKKERARRPDPLGRLPPQQPEMPWLYRWMPFLYKKPQVEEIRLQEMGGTEEYLPFTPGTGARGFLHSGHLNRLYCWLDALAHNI